MAAGVQDRAREADQALEVVSSVVRLLRQAAGGRAEDLSLTQFRLLKRLAHNVRLATELADDLDVTSATISAAVDGLVRRGLVERRVSARDRRSVPLAATAQGLEALDAARHRQHQALSAIVERLRPTERRALQVALGGLARVLADAGRPKNPPE